MFFVSVASKGLSQTVSLLFATLAGRSISVAAKEVKEIVGSDPDRVGAGQWTEVSEEKNRRRKLETDEWARVGCGSFREGRNLRLGLKASIHKTE